MPGGTNKSSVFDVFNLYVPKAALFFLTSSLEVSERIIADVATAPSNFVIEYCIFTPHKVVLTKTILLLLRKCVKSSISILIFQNDTRQLRP